MLILEQYGIKLRRVVESDLEMIRNWRNKPGVAAFMEYREHITSEQQLKWFASINNKYNYYFIIENCGENAGVINIRNCNIEAGYGEGGIFIGEEKFLDTFVSAFSSLCLLNFTLLRLRLTRKSRIKILRENKRAIHYNKALGYKLLPGQDDVYNQEYELDVDDYIKYGKKLNYAAALLNRGNAQLKISGTVSDLNFDEINNLIIQEK